jgi:hypothetical protein
MVPQRLRRPAAVCGCSKNATNPKAEKKGFFSGYTAIDRRDDTALMEALYTHGPLAVSMDAGGKLFKYYGQGVYDDPSCGNSDVSASPAAAGKLPELPDCQRQHSRLCVFPLPLCVFPMPFK